MCSFVDLSYVRPPQVSFVTCLFCFIMGIGASYQKEWSWKAEPICATILSLLCCAEGMRVVYIYFDDIDDLLMRHARP